MEARRVMTVRRGLSTLAVTAAMRDTGDPVACGPSGGLAIDRCD